MVPRILLSIVLAMAASGSLATSQRVQIPHAALSLHEFGQLMTSLSEAEGHFDSDNFVSNEAAYLKILPALGRLGVRGGVYLGVGPDQNYSYIAEIRPELAILIDIRKQNALQHLYYKALFQLSANRAQYLERLFGRKIRGPDNLTSAGISGLLGLIDLAPRNASFGNEVVSEACQTIRSWNLGLADTDLEAIRYIADAFIGRGPDLKFTSYNRAARSHHPTYRSLLQETDLMGVQCNFLAQERRFQTVKTLHCQNRIVPIVGDLGGSVALRRIAEELRRRNLRVQCFYVSNVEFYLFGGDRWPLFVRNIRGLPWEPIGVLIRSYANMWRPHPAQIPGYYMTTLLQSARSFLENEARGKDETYWDLVTTDYTAH